MAAIRSTADEAGATSNAMLGLSGLDTSAMLKSMMAQYKKPIAVATQKQQLVLWRQEKYREIITKTQSFRDKFFDYKNPATNVLSLGSFRKYKVNNPGSEYVKITTTGATKAASGKIEVQKMPTASSVQGKVGLTQAMTGSSAPDWADAVGFALSINMDGVVRNIEITSDINSAAKLQQALDSAFGTGRVNVTDYGMGGELHFYAGVGVNQISIYDGTSMSARYALGFGSSANTSNRILSGSTLESISSRLQTPLTFTSVPTGQHHENGTPIMHNVVAFSINGKEFEFDSKTTLSTVLETINNDPTANVELKYDNAADAFVLKAKMMGPGDTVKLKETGSNFLTAIGLMMPKPTDVDMMTGGIVDVSAVNAASGTATPMAFTINIDGTAVNVVLDDSAGYADADDIKAHIDSQIQAAIPGVHVYVIGNSMGIGFNHDQTVSEITFSAATGQTPAETTESFYALGLSDIGKSRVGVVAPDLTAINDAITANEPLVFSININGVTKQINMDNVLGFGTYTVYADNAELAADINAKLQIMFPGCGVTYKVQESGPWAQFIYDDTVERISFGAVSGQSEEEWRMTRVALGLGTDFPVHTSGDFGKVLIGDTVLAVDRLNFEYEGVGYELKKETPVGEPVEFSVEVDAEPVIQLVKDFVEAYNEIIAMIEDGLGEKRELDYAPLTDEQRANMSDKEIERWEMKAKSGLLRGDPNFIAMNSKIRLSIFNPVYKEMGSNANIGMNLEQIGVFTNNWEERGQLHLNEDKLRLAIEENLEGVAQLFAKTPQTYEYDETQSVEWNARKKREYEDLTGGIGYKLLNVLNDYVRTTRDSHGIKGVLVERAGVLNDLSDIQSAFSQEISRYDQKITDLWERYDRIEKSKIRTLSRLESYVSSMSAQTAWMTQQMSGQQQ